MKIEDLLAFFDLYVDELDDDEEEFVNAIRASHLGERLSESQYEQLLDLHEEVSERIA